MLSKILILTARGSSRLSQCIHCIHKLQIKAFRIFSLKIKAFKSRIEHEIETN